MKQHPTIGLALGSGGAKGLSHIGVIEALVQHNIPINYIAGSSIGALIGALYAANPDTTALRDLTNAMNWKTILFLFDPALKGGLMKGEKVEKLLREWFGDKTFADLKIPFTAVATDFTTGEEVHLNEGDVVKALRASISVPGIFKPVEVNKHLLADGGLSNPVPDNVVRDMGATIVISVNLDTPYFQEANLLDSPVPLVSMRAISILRYHLAKRSIKDSDIVLRPKVYDIGLVGWNHFFDKNKVASFIQAGEEVTLDALPEINTLLSLATHQTRIQKYVSFLKNRLPKF